MVVAKGFNTLCLVFCLSNFYPLAKSIPCKGSATYKLSFQGEWSKTPSRPNEAKFSGLIGCSHNICYQMWERGEKASLGVKNVAEKGNTRQLRSEVSSRIENTNHVLEIIESRAESVPPEGNVIVPETNTTTDGFRVDAAHPLVSVIVGIVPSPDWFIGVEDFDLCDISTGNWFTEKIEKLFPYDAGTDSGTEFNNSVDVPTNPAQKIERLRDSSLYDSSRGMGFFVFTRLRIFPKRKEGEYGELMNNIVKLSRNKTTWQPFYQGKDEIIKPEGITKLQQNVRVDALRPMVSVIARIDPSPDWFVGISSIDLCDRKTGEWMLEKKVFPLLPYDAGARSGNTFSTTGSPTNEDISRVDEGIFSDWYNTRDILGLFHFSRHQVSQSSVVGETENDETFQCPSMASRHVWSSLISVIAALLFVWELF